MGLTTHSLAGAKPLYTFFCAQLLISCVISSKDHRFSWLFLPAPYCLLSHTLFITLTHTQLGIGICRSQGQTTRENIFAAFYKYLIIFSLHFGMNFSLPASSSSFNLTYYTFSSNYTFDFLLFVLHADFFALFYILLTYNHKHSHFSTV